MADQSAWPETLLAIGIRTLAEVPPPIDTYCILYIIISDIGVALSLYCSEAYYIIYNMSN
jgi:hypothetical protein